MRGEENEVFWREKTVSEPSWGFHTDLGSGEAAPTPADVADTVCFSLSFYCLLGPSWTSAGTGQESTLNCACLLEVSLLGGPGS